MALSTLSLIVLISVSVQCIIVWSVLVTKSESIEINYSFRQRKDNSVIYRAIRDLDDRFPREHSILR